MQKYLKETSFVQIVSETFFFLEHSRIFMMGAKCAKKCNHAVAVAAAAVLFFSKVPITKMTLEYNNRLDER